MDDLLRIAVWRLDDGDDSSLEHCALGQHQDGWFLAGEVVAVIEGRPAFAHYRVECDASWATRSVEVALELASERMSLHLRVDDERRWWLDGQERADLHGCTDVDLGITPATNTLPIRRLALQPGAHQTITAAWVLFPSLEIVRAEQHYTRQGESRYEYAGSSGRTYALDVDDLGLVTQYDEYWRRVAQS